MISRLAYRTHQFRNSLFSSNDEIPSEVLHDYLTSAQFKLFQQMQPSEQAHAYKIFKHLKNTGRTNPDLLCAALLHDVGKILHPLSIYERVLIVLGRGLFPKATRRWAGASPHGLRRPFVVAAQHAEWGAELAAQAGATTLTVELIRHHHDTAVHNPDSHAQHLLAALQAADDEN
jgi:hypothetical protein